MALDHYVSQVHLRNFYSPVLGGKKMYAMRKSDLKRFHCGSEDVCRIENGSTNDYLLESRIIEEFLTPVERNYNASIDKLKNGDFDCNAIYVIAGFVSYILSCSPTAMRIGAGPLRDIVEKAAELLDRTGVLPAPPPELGGASLIELLRNRKVVVEIDGKYPQALAISSIQHHIAAFGNSDWDVLVNESSCFPFFTSDFPVAIEPSGDPRILNRIATLTPNLAVRIRPSIEEKRRSGGFDFRHFRGRVLRLNRQEVHEINERIVRCAEQLVFFRDDSDWVEPFVRRNANFLLDSITHQIPHEGGTLHLTTLRIVEREART